MKIFDVKIFGVPVFGGILPFIGRRALPLNRDGSFVDTGKGDLLAESGYYFVKPLVFEWLVFGIPLAPSLVYLTATGEPVTPDFEIAGD